MTDKFSSSEYHVEKSEKWWEKDIDPTISFIFLVGAMISVFGMGVIFMREYSNVWQEISQREKEYYSTSLIIPLERPETNIQFEDIVLP